MNRHLHWILALAPVVIMIGGVPFFAGNGRIWVLPELAFWFLIWVVLTPCALVAADRVYLKGQGR